MRVAVITTSYPTHDGDPAGHFVHAEVARLEAAGDEVHVLRPAPGGAFGWPGAMARIRQRPMRVLDAAGWTVHASARLRNLDVDRIVAHWCLPCAFPISFAGRGAELEIVSHGSDVRLLCALPRPARASVFRTLVRRASRWRFVSEELRGTLEDALSTDEASALRSISTVGAGALIVPDVHEDARAKRSAMRGRRLYVCAGRLVPSKRVDKVIDYVATSTHDGGPVNRHERVLVVLGDGPERPRLERLARHWQMDVRFLGKTTRVETLGWIGAADELVHASQLEGLSTVVREAEHLGVPVTRLS